MSLIGTVTQGLSLLTLISHIFLVLFLLGLLYRPLRTRLVLLARRHAVWMSFLIAMMGVALSLFYSEIAGYLPCRLCWFQRIFLYPQALLFAVALWRKDKSVFAYALPLMVIGGLIGVYHVFLTLNPSAETCAATGVSCAANYFLSFGYISIPVMSLTAFALLLVIGLLARQKA